MHLTIIKIKKKIIKNNLSLSLSHNTHTYVKMLSKSILLKKKKIDTHWFENEQWCQI